MFMQMINPQSIINVEELSIHRAISMYSENRGLSPVTSARLSVTPWLYCAVWSMCTVGQCVCYHLNACLMIKETPLLYIMLTLSSRQKGHKTSIQVHVWSGEEHSAVEEVCVPGSHFQHQCVSYCTCKGVRWYHSLFGRFCTCVHMFRMTRPCRLTGL